MSYFNGWTVTKFENILLKFKYVNNFEIYGKNLKNIDFFDKILHYLGIKINGFSKFLIINFKFMSLFKIHLIYLIIFSNIYKNFGSYFSFYLQFNLILIIYV